jgi:hypothetical protein
MDIVILLPLVLDLFLPWIMKLLSSFYSFFNLELFKILFLWIMHHLLSLIWNFFFSLENGIILLLWLQFVCFNVECYCSEEKHIVGTTSSIILLLLWDYFGYNLCVFYARHYCNGEKNILCTSLVTSHAHHSFFFLSSSLDQF